ncbi:MAG: endonuclease domain-containing protein [Bacteroidaceae bacterium]|nr:endonuclease domain-containing protein [Bacteroidaceae bacterium]
MDFHWASPDRYDILRGFAKENRKNQTLAESVLWDALRTLDVGTRFNRQFIIGDYIVDFISQHEGLIIEVDGGYHAERQQQEDDAVREQYLEQRGFHVMRFSNEEVLYDLDNVLQ